ncbi:hypothetical protein D3C75_575740 [compost metagenome]
MSRLLTGHEDAADVDRQGAIQVIQSQLLKVAPYQYPDIVDENVQPSEAGDALAYGVLYGHGIRAVGTDGQGLAARRRDGRDKLFCLAGGRDIGKGHGGTVASEALHNGGTYAAGTTLYEGNLSTEGFDGQHLISPVW